MEFIIAAYEQNDDAVTARLFFDKMQQVGIRPDLLTLVSLPSIVAQLNDHRNSRAVHGFITRKCWFEDTVIGNAVVDMYAKLGVTDVARMVFERLPAKDVISWNTLITGYTQNGLASEAVEVYQMMKECTEITPTQGTWVSILPAYSHLGALQQGMRIHGQEEYGIKPTLKHYGCMVDLFGRAGYLEMAYTFIKSMPIQPDASMWGALLGACRIHGNTELGRLQLSLLELQLDFQNPKVSCFQNENNHKLLTTGCQLCRNTYGVQLLSGLKIPNPLAMGYMSS
ncbi:hypothetical protein GH714_006717 [Hevea brasiliensis]|uniref:Pentacotripeptide-repeat region of PRORP domain-containing protein n=1 Tax=Hevea brasiliensis TaxID=3981 RepID=A0A6A6MZ65_HEVBR|nr:hypothetical protein GH714_006717 [Hevea brasiliensis]